MFYLASLSAYVQYVRQGRKSFYIGSLFLFILALLSKGQAVTLFFSVLLVDLLLWSDRKPQRVLLDKIPYFLLSTTFGILVILTQKSTGYLVVNIPYHERILYAAYGFIHYISKLLMPIKLSAIYPYPAKTSGHVPYIFWLYVLISLVIAGVGVLAMIKRKYSGFGILFFILNIAVMLKLIPNSNFLTADRYLYIASIGFFFLVGAGYESLSSMHRIKRSAALALTVYIIVLATLTYSRTHVWKDSLTLYNNVLLQYPDFSGALNDRGVALASEGKFEAALKDYNKAIRNDPLFYKTYTNRANIRYRLGDIEEALEDLNTSIKIHPNAVAYYNRGNIKFNTGDFTGAVSDYSKAADFNQNHAPTYYNRGNASYKLGYFEEAIADYQTALLINPDLTDAYLNLGAAYGMMGKMMEEVKTYREALKRGPGPPEIHLNLGAAYLRLGDKESAMKQHRILKRMNTTLADKLLSMIIGQK
jgi:tetratricopeptide (TPR) repeat protein